MENKENFFRINNNHCEKEMSTSKIILLSFLFLMSNASYASDFIMHTIKPATIDPLKNTVPNMVVLHNIDADDHLDLIVSHVGWKKSPVHPYVSWFKGPHFKKEYTIIDKSTVGKNSRIYRFVLHDVDKDGRADLIGQGYQPNHNGNKWYRCPEDPRLPWKEYYDYGNDLQNGHDILLWDIDNNGEKDLLLLDSHVGKVIVKPIPSKKFKAPWEFYTIIENIGFTHYMSLYDVNSDGLLDIVLGKEEDGGKGIFWLEHPGYKNVNSIWQKHFVFNANFTKVFARDFDNDGDTDFVGTGENFVLEDSFITLTKKIAALLFLKTSHVPSDEQTRLALSSIRKRCLSSDRPWINNKDLGWLESTSSLYVMHEFDKKDNMNDVIGGHNCELIDVDNDGDEDLVTGGVDVLDFKQRFRWYEFDNSNNTIQWIEHPLGVTSSEGFKPQHGYYCGEITSGDIDKDGDIDLFYASVGSGFLGWFENTMVE